MNLKWIVDFICFENNLLDMSALWTQIDSEIKSNNLCFIKKIEDLANIVSNWGFE